MQTGWFNSALQKPQFATFEKLSQIVTAKGVARVSPIDEFEHIQLTGTLRIDGGAQNAFVKQKAHEWITAHEVVFSQAKIAAKALKKQIDFLANKYFHLE